MNNELLPCPFCGNEEPRKALRLDESLWSHNTVEWLHIKCDECDCESVDSEVHEEVIAAWNKRHLQARPLPVGWKLVPIEPTPEMSAAGFTVSEAEHDPAGVYRAMLAASPEKESALPVDKEKSNG